jgi:hypothetical protein
MLLAVAVASPGTIRLEKAAVNEKPIAMAIIRYRTPVILAVFLIEFILDSPAALRIGDKLPPGFDGPAKELAPANLGDGQFVHLVAS